MKYGKSVVDDISQLPLVYQQVSINYKGWKQLVKSDKDATDYVETLERTCELIDDVFCHQSDMIYNKRVCSVLPCSWRSFKTFKKLNNISWLDAFTRLNKLPRVDIVDLIRFAEINNTTLYKVCKKIDKHTNTNEGRLWLMKTREEKTYKFMSGIMLTRLRLDKANQIQECPICMDVMGVLSNRLLILNCGHAICMSCIYRITNIRNNGTLYNMLLNVDNKSFCPLCIRKHPFSDVSQLSLWQKNEKHDT